MFWCLRRSPKYHIDIACRKRKRKATGLAASKHLDCVGQGTADKEYTYHIPRRGQYVCNLAYMVWLVTTICS